MYQNFNGQRLGGNCVTTSLQAKLRALKDGLSIAINMGITW